MTGTATVYDRYGPCPLAVESGKITLGEFGYGSKVVPSLLWDSTILQHSAWTLKKTSLPWLYWNDMLKGKEWLARPNWCRDGVLSDAYFSVHSLRIEA